MLWWWRWRWWCCTCGQCCDGDGDGDVDGDCDGDGDGDSDVDGDGDVAPVREVHCCLRDPCYKRLQEPRLQINMVLKIKTQVISNIDINIRLQCQWLQWRWWQVDCCCGLQLTMTTILMIWLQLDDNANCVMIGLRLNWSWTMKTTLLMIWLQLEGLLPVRPAGTGLRSTVDPRFHLQRDLLPNFPFYFSHQLFSIFFSVLALSSHIVSIDISRISSLR